MSYIEDKNIDVAGICETWLTESHNATTAIIKSYGFSLYTIIIEEHRRVEGLQLSLNLSLDYQR